MASLLDSKMNEKSFFDSSKHYLIQRNNTFHISQPVRETSIWDRMAPDFSLESYQSIPPKRLNLYSKSHKDNTLTRTAKHSRNDNLYERMQTMPILNRNENKNDFITNFRLQRPFSAKVQYSKSGCYKKGIYESPKPHDFRGIKPIQELGLPEMKTIFEKDPGNIRLYSSSLSLIRSPLSETGNEKEFRGGNIYRPVEKKSKWEQGLHLPRDQWPSMPKEFTRFRIINQNSELAFLDRVEKVLSLKWEQEKYKEKQLK